MPASSVLRVQRPLLPGAHGPRGLLHGARHIKLAHVPGRPRPSGHCLNVRHVIDWTVGNRVYDDIRKVHGILHFDRISHLLNHDTCRQGEQDFLGSIGASGWIASTNLPLRGSFYYAAGPEVNFDVTISPWAVGQPADSGPLGSSHCIRLANMAWTTANCLALAGYIVEYECPAGFVFTQSGCKGLCNTDHCVTSRYICHFRRFGSLSRTLLPTAHRAGRLERRWQLFPGTDVQGREWALGHRFHHGRGRLCQCLWNSMG